MVITIPTAGILKEEIDIKSKPKKVKKLNPALLREFKALGYLH